jgi:hypothetical protein
LEFTLSLSDLSLLFKKIAVGVIVSFVPLMILAGGIWLTRTLLDRAPAAASAPQTHQ